MLTFMLLPGKNTVCAFSVIVLCFLCRSALAQQHTAKDSAAYQKGLAESHSDAERINYELELAEYSIKKPGNFKFDLDNAQRWINKAKQLNAKLNSKEAQGHILIEEGYLLRENGPSTQGRDMIAQGIALLKNTSDKSLLAGAYRNLGDCYDPNNPQQVAARVASFKQAIKCYKQCGNKKETAIMLEQLAETYLSMGGFQPAKNSIVESLAVYNSINYKEVQALYDLLGVMYAMQADYGNALKYQLKAVRICDELKDSSMLTCEIKNHLGIMYSKLDQANNALTYLNAALFIAELHKDPPSVRVISVNISRCYTSLKDYKSALDVLDESSAMFKDVPIDNAMKMTTDDSYVIILSKLKKPDRARPYVEDILRLMFLPDVSPLNLPNSYRALVSYYFLIKNYNAILAIMPKYQKAAEETKFPAYRTDYLGFWYQLDSVRNDYKGGFAHLLKYKALEDSIFNEKKTQQIALLQNSYENQQKESEIRLKSADIELLTKNAKLAKAQLKGVRFTRNVTLAGIVVFILIFGMQYRRYQEKQKMNLLITGKNAELQKLVTEKEWLLKEVHHRVKNNLHTVICLLESQAAYLENDALKAVESSQHRIFAMSLVHQRLYQSTDIQTVDIANYLSEFIMYLKESFGEPANIAFQQEIESMRLDVSQAIPIALIVNEAVTNAIKYAFPEHRRGVIKVGLAREADSLRLSIEDNGVGIPEGVQTEKLTSLGLELIKGLTDDLKGRVQFLVKKGTSVVVSFNKGPVSHIAAAALAGS